MNVEQIEKFLVNLLHVLDTDDTLTADIALPVFQLQMLVHIYRKLESIDDSLIMNMKKEEVKA